ncbi:MAG: hypothetical protein HC912_04800 [Saprospiraceae bacterium]|nr:hypothetical protein [Saprospiraceae bacterium]
MQKLTFVPNQQKVIMIQLNFIQENKALVIAGLRKRNYKDEDLLLVDKIIDLDDQRKNPNRNWMN